MPVNLTFNTVTEKKPEHGQTIIWLQTTSSFDYAGFNPREVEVEYQYTEYQISHDGHKIATGNAIVYDKTESPPENEGNIVYEISILVDGWEMKDEDLWMNVEEYWNAFQD